MKKKATKKKVSRKKAPGKSKKVSTKLQLQRNLKKFKSQMQKSLGQVKWAEIGLAALAILLVVAAKGFFGPKAALLAHAVIKSMALA